jgi:hypothetical protein
MSSKTVTTGSKDTKKSNENERLFKNWMLHANDSGRQFKPSTFAAQHNDIKETKTA